jgi:lipid A 3-O-deacylase
MGGPIRRCMRRAFVAAVVAGATLPAAHAADETLGTFVIQDENDFFAGTDRHYTQGIRLSYLAPARATPDWIRGLPDIPALIGAGRGRRADRRLGFVVGQSMFTPQDTDKRSLITSDRPYAGWLYLGGSMQTRYRDLSGITRLDILAFELGVVGPAAHAEYVQNKWHELIRSNRVNGWDNQLHNEPAFLIAFERKWRSPVLRLDGGKGRLELGLDAIPHVGFTGGTVHTYAAAGLTVRFGNHLPDDFGPPRIRPASPGSQSFEPPQSPRPFRWYLFAGFETRLVGRNIFLDGNTFRSSHHVDKNPVVTDLQVGLATVLFDKVRLTYTYVLRSPEFRGQRGPDQFGAISLSIRF